MEEIDAFMASQGFKKKGLCLQCVADVGEGNRYNALYER